METKDLIKQSEVNRRRLMEIIYKAGAGHTGGDLSVMNLMTALYFDIMNVNPDDPKMPERDRFVLSKGHCVEALYTVLEARGFIKPGVLDTLGQFGSVLSGHPTIEVPGIEVNTGALGHGLPIGVGMAIAAKMDGKAYKTFVVMGDGEQGEGSIYEAAMAGNMYHLDNLVAVIDRNYLQISGNTDERRRYAVDSRHVPRHRLQQRETPSRRFAHHQGQGRKLHGERGQMAPRRAHSGAV